MAFWLCLLIGTSPRLAAAAAASGTYLGDGTASRAISGLGFSPSFVLLKSERARTVCFKTSTLPGALTKVLPDAMVDSLKSDLVLSLDPDGFTVGAGNKANEAGAETVWFAASAAPGEVAVDSFLGDGGGARDVTGLGFAPDFVLAFAEDGIAQLRFSSQTGEVSFPANNRAGVTGELIALLPDGFRVGGGSSLNAAGGRTHFVAIRAVAGRGAAGSYVGNGAAQLAVEGLSFAPGFVLARTEAAEFAVWRVPALSDGLSAQVGWEAHPVGAITALTPDGFAVGQATAVNVSGTRTHWLALEASQSTPVARLTPEALQTDVEVPALLDARASTPSSGAELIDYEWTLVEGPTGVQFASGAIQAIDFAVPGSYRIRLRVTDSKAKTSVPAELRVQVSGETPPVPRLGCSTAGASPALALLGLLFLTRLTGAASIRSRRASRQGLKP